MNKEQTAEEFNKIRNIPLVFIMGKERSGTTLLQTLLDEHPNIVAPPESKFILLLYPRFGNIKKWSEKNIYEFVKELYREPWIAKIWHIDRELLTSVLLSIKDTADYASICKVVYYCMRNSKENILLISDKNPVYVLFVKTLLQIFPEAKFIHIVRDPRDNVNSHLKAFRSKNVRFVATKWLSYNKILEKSAGNLPGKFYTLLYENLVTEPEEIMKELCGFLNVMYNPKMIFNTFPERIKNFSDEKPIFERALNIHANLLQPVNTKNIGKWKIGLTPERIQLIEAITGAFASSKYNYDIESSIPHLPISIKMKIFKTRIIYSCWQFFTRLKFKSYRFNTSYTEFNIMIGREKKEFARVEHRD